MYIRIQCLSCTFSGEDVPLVPIYVRKSTLRLPYRSTCPVIMVGPGTGLAPFRGFIEDRCMTKKNGKDTLHALCTVYAHGREIMIEFNTVQVYIII